MHSRKVFVGGLPPDMDQDEIIEHILLYGPLTVGWPYKAKFKAAYFPHKGYAFLMFREEISASVSEEEKLYVFVSSLTQINKKAQICPWNIADSSFIMDHSQPIDLQKTIFVGGVPPPP